MFNVKVGDIEYHVGFNYEDNITECFITEVTGKIEITDTVGIGYSVCKYPDVFNKNVGRKKSLKRAMDYLNLTREERKLFWSRYWEKRGKID